MKKIIIIDGNSLAYSNVPDHSKVKDKYLFSTTGEEIFIVRKFLKKLLIYKWLKFKDYHCVVVFDEIEKKTFRHELSDRYKKKTVNEKRQNQKKYVYAQIEVIKKYLKRIGIPFYSSNNWEADDIIGMLVEKFEKKGSLTTIVTGDKDILQLISPLTRVLYNDAGSKTQILTNRKNVWDVSGGVWPDQVIDIKILSGDSSDNIKGLGIIRDNDGRVDYWTQDEAVELIKKWGSLDNALNNINKLPNAFKTSLERSAEKIELNKKLVTIVRDWSLNIKVDHFYKYGINKVETSKIIEELNLDELLKNKSIRKEIK